MKAIITGATGFIGGTLARAIAMPILLGRNPAKMRALFPAAKSVEWSPGREISLPEGAWDGVDAVIHLAGESLFKGRLTEKKKREVRDSRIHGTRALVRLMEKAPSRPRVFICASAIGIYGEGGEQSLDENAEQGTGFLADLCRQWEEEARRATQLGIRVVCVRIGLVLGKGGGVLAQMLPPFRHGLGGRLGSGHQYMSWIHIDDLVGIMLHAVGAASLSGPVNGVSPNPVTNRNFTAILGKILSQPTILPVPAFALRLAFGELATEILASRKVIPQKAIASGYQYRFPQLEKALSNLIPLLK